MRPEFITRKQWLTHNVHFVLQHFLGVERASRWLKKSKEKLAKSIAANPGIEKRGFTYDVKEIERESFQPYLNNKKALLDGPLVFRNAAKEWPAVKTWSKSFFKENYGDYEIALIGNKGLADSPRVDKFQRTSFGEYLSYEGNDRSYYLRFSRIIDDYPDTLRKDIDVSWLQQFRSGLHWGENLYLFLGEAGSKTSMHNALIQSLFIQIKGKKIWTLYEPSERIFLDPVVARMPYYYTHVNPNDTDDPRYPLLKYARKYVIELNPGDVLWFPSYYWHYVENPTANIGVTYKYTNIPQAFGQTKLLTALFFLATKPSLLTSFWYNRTKKRDYIFDKAQ